MVFKIVMLNVRSLFSNIDQVRHYFEGYDIICLCETWLTDGHTKNMVDISGYDHIRLDRSSGNIRSINNHPKRGGGLVIYYKKDISPYVTMLPCSKISSHLEQLWIQIKRPDHRTQIISVIYRPPTGNSQLFFDELYTSMDYIADHSTAEMTVMGDVNIDYKLRHTKDYSLIKDFERDFQLKQLIDKPTRITPRHSSTIDLIFSNMEYISDSGVLDIKISDHLPIFIYKKKDKIKQSFSTTKGRTYKNYVKEVFENLILNDNRWVDYWDPDLNVDEIWDIMFNIILDAANITCPMVSMKIANGNPAWFCNEVLEEIHLKDELYNQFRSTNDLLDWENFKIQNNFVKNLIKNSKENFIKEQLEQNTGNPNKFWRYINTITGLGKAKTSIDHINLVDENGIDIEGSAAAEYMNEYYATAGYNLLKNLNDTWTPNNNMFKEYKGFHFEEISEYEILKIVKDIKISKSSAYKELSSRLFKDAFQILIKEITYLFNICIQKGVFPTEWGYAEVTPIPKVGDLHQVKNWRPISQIKLPGKLLERVIHRQLSTYFEEILHKNQHGFRNSKSTGTAIFDVLQDLFQNWNNKCYSSCIFIDYSKAFDTIDHDILLKKLKIYGLDNTALLFLKSYLENRYQRINIDTMSSNYSKLKCGVPQGSIIGPLLFIIYTNDIFLEIKEPEGIYMYADDTLLINKGSTEEIAIQNSQTCFNRVITWCKLNRLTLNESKTKHLCITNKKQTPTLKINAEINMLGNVDTYDYLGFSMDRRLNMNTHIDKIIKKVGFKLYTLTLMRRFLTMKTALLIYKVMILPHFDYVDFVIDSATKVCTTRIERLHKRAIRKIENISDVENREKYDVLLREYGLTTLYERRIEHLLLFMYKKSKVSKDSLSIQRPKIELRSRNKVKFKQVFTDKSKVLNSPFYRGLYYWNQLPTDVQTSETVSIFKGKVRILVNGGQIKCQ